MTWTRERPKGVDCIRDYRASDLQAGVRLRDYYQTGEHSAPDSVHGYTDSWWHPVRADGRYPALPVEDGRKWVREYPAGMAWYSWKDDDGIRRLDRWVSEEVGFTSLSDDTWCLPYVEGDTRDTLPPLPSEELPDPLTPAEEATLREPVKVRVANLTPDEAEAMMEESNRNRWEQMSRPPAPDPSRLEILKDMVRTFLRSWDGDACKGTTPQEIAAERAAWRANLIDTAVVWTDEIIAAARKGGGA